VIARATNRNVTPWRDGQMVLRWTAAGMLNAERFFRRIKGHKHMPQLVAALNRHAHPETVAGHRICRCRRLQFIMDRHPSR
jgi:putative transposase